MIRREERIGDCRLLLGDARDIVSGLQPDVLITDPVWPNCPANLIPGSNDPWGLWSAFCERWPSVARAVVVMRHDSDPRFLSAITMPFARTVILPYVIPSYIGRYLGGDELAYCFGEPIPYARGQTLIPGRAPPVQPSGRPPNGHPCSRALEHFNFLVRWWSEPGETILDPFMGSGTTLIAAMKQGRPAIGVEIDEGYFDIAVERLRQAHAQPDMFVESSKRQREEAADAG